jgi:hypothetical protein
MTMATFEFKVYLDRMPTDDEFDALYEAGFDDSTPGTEGASGVIQVTREADSLPAAIESVLTGAARAGFAVVGVEDEDLVGLRTIATRLGRTSEYVRLLAAGKRGPGGFPVVTSGDGWSLYSWTAVAAWAREHLGADVTADEQTRILAVTDHILRARALATDKERDFIRVLVA